MKKIATKKEPKPKAPTKPRKKAAPKAKASLQAQVPTVSELVEHRPIASNAPLWEKPKVCTPEMFEQICERVADGESLGTIGKCHDMPARLIIRRYIASSDEIKAMYARAVEDRGDSRAEQLDGLVKRVVTGDLDPNAARVAIDTIKWQTAKEKPRTYGDKLDIEAKVTTQNLTDDQINARLMQLAEATANAARSE